MGLRVSPEEEIEGLDVFEHGGSAYPYFVGASSYGRGEADIGLKEPELMIGKRKYGTAIQPAKPAEEV